MLKVPPLGATAVKGNDKLYSHYNCAPGDGAFLSKVDKRGAFHAADPPITENSFITKVGDITLDSYGEGKNENYIQDLVKFGDLIFMGHDMATPTKVTTCKCGNIQEHLVSHEWDATKYETPITDDQQPNLVTHPFLTFGNVTLQVLTKTIAHHLILAQGQLDLIPYIVPENEKSAVIVTDVGHSDLGIGGKKTLQVGSVVKEINGHKIENMTDVENAFVPSGTGSCGTGSSSRTSSSENSVWILKTADGHMHSFDYMAEMRRMAGTAGVHSMSPILKEAMNAANIQVSSASVLQTADKPAVPDTVEAGVEVLPIEYRNVYRGGMTTSRALDQFLGTVGYSGVEETEEGPAKPSSFVQMGPGGITPQSLMQLGRKKAHPSSFVEMGPNSMEPLSLIQLHRNRK